MTMKLTPGAFAALGVEDSLNCLRNGDFAAADLVEASLQRLRLLEPAVNAMITIDAENAAARAAAWNAQSDAPLSGLPVAVKDNIMIRSLRATCGSRILENFVPPYTATSVEKLLAAGAIVVGKTNMDEFAMGSTGENSAYGPTRNPWNRDLVTGGSSSGSAAVVAYGGVAAALGSDTGGSIRQPASFCGLVGLKPTYGRVSRWGLGALASSLDQIGPLTRSVRDNALIFDMIAGCDRRDSTSSPKLFQPVLPTIEDGIAGLRVGYDPALFAKEGMAASQSGALRQALDICRDNGAQLVETSLPYIDYGVAAYYIICSCEASANLTRYDGVRYGVRKQAASLWETYSETRGQGFGAEVKRRIMMGAYALSSGYYDAFYLKAAKVRRLIAEAYQKLMAEVDVFLLPVAPRPPRPVGTRATTLENYLGDIFTLPANLTGVPALAFPTGVADKLPVGVQGMAGYFREDVLYRLARVVEKHAVLEGAPWNSPGKEGGQ